jgi:adenosylmethionine-8-amino-7-oxononanoate aminotransferase
LGALAVGGNLLRRAQFDPLLVPSHHIAPCYAYRGCRAGETEEAYGLRVANELETKILELGPDTIIGFVAETVVGATLGTVPAVPGYFRRIREICDRYGILLILDEIMCGMGRTGTVFACEQEDLQPDVLVVAKGLGGGYQPIGATIVSEKIYNAFLAGSGAFQHGHTYLGHPVACAAGVAVQQVVREQKLLSRVREMGAYLTTVLTARFAKHPHVGDIRGRGLFQSIELVEDRASKRPFDPRLRMNGLVKRAAMDRGLICYPMGGTVDGKSGDHVMLAPPFIAEQRHIDEIVEKLAGALEDALDAGGKLR